MLFHIHIFFSSFFNSTRLGISARAFKTLERDQKKKWKPFSSRFRSFTSFSASRRYGTEIFSAFLSHRNQQWFGLLYDRLKDIAREVRRKCVYGTRGARVKRDELIYCRNMLCSVCGIEQTININKKSRLFWRLWMEQPCSYRLEVESIIIKCHLDGCDAIRFNFLRRFA